MIGCLGIIGGSGLYNLNGLKNTEWIKVDTPWGNPSDEILTHSVFFKPFKLYKPDPPIMPKQLII